MAFTDLAQGVSGGSGIGINDLIDAEVVSYLTVTLADIANKYITFSAPVGAGAKLRVCPMTGAPLHYGVDYSVDAGLSRVTWNGLALDGVIEAGDTLRLIYNSPA
jgi:hypothetical protein